MRGKWKSDLEFEKFNKESVKKGVVVREISKKERGTFGLGKV